MKRGPFSIEFNAIDNIKTVFAFIIRKKVISTYYSPLLAFTTLSGREMHATSFVNTARTTSKVMRNVTQRGNVLEKLARRMRLTRIVDSPTTSKKTSKKTSNKT